MAACLIACGIDPEKTILFQQSKVRHLSNFVVVEGAGGGGGGGGGAEGLGGWAGGNGGRGAEEGGQCLCTCIQKVFVCASVFLNCFQVIQQTFDA